MIEGMIEAGICSGCQMVVGSFTTKKDTSVPDALHCAKREKNGNGNGFYYAISIDGLHYCLDFFHFLLLLENSEDVISFSEFTAFHVPVTKKGLQHYTGVGFKWSTRGWSAITYRRDQQALYQTTRSKHILISSLTSS